VLLSLELCRAGRCRHRGSVAACLSRCVAVRSEEPLLRSEIGARRTALAERRCETRSQDEPGSARAVARNARTRRHGHTPPRQSIVDYAGHACAVAHRRKTRGPESVGNKKRSASGPLPAAIGSLCQHRTDTDESALLARSRPIKYSVSLLFVVAAVF